MMTLYVFRERIRSLYQKYELYLEPIIKFILGFVVFTLINKSIGFDTRLTRFPVVLILSLLSAFVPSSVLVLLAAGVSFVHVYGVSKILSVIVVLIMLVLYLFFIRLTPKLGIVVVAMPILFILKIPYTIPLLLGVVATPISALAAGCGVIVYYLLAVIKDAASVQVSVSLEDTLQLYKYVCDSLLNNKQMLMTILIFAVVICIMYVIRKLKIDYAYEIAIVTGAVVCILCFLISDLKLDVSEQIVSMIVGTICSAVIVYIILFFKQALDYTGVEYTQFEDDDYMYYVKAVPKINVTTPQKNVKRINPQKTMNIKEEISHNRKEYDDQYDDEYDDSDDTGEIFDDRD